MATRKKYTIAGMIRNLEDRNPGWTAERMHAECLRRGYLTSLIYVHSVLSGYRLNLSLRDRVAKARRRQAAAAGRDAVRS